LFGLLLSAVDPGWLRAGDIYRHPSAPWNQKGYQGYNEPPHATTPVNPAAAPVAPTKYRLIVTIVPPQNTDESSTTATIMAHLPENALVFFGDHLTTSTGMLRMYESPPLGSGNYSYTVRVNWVEEGKKVTQTQHFKVRPGMIHCIYLVKAGSEEARIADNLARFSPEDRLLAEAQKFCAVQEQNRLGSMGPPFKLVIKGQPVFLCCEACSARAQSNADQTVAKVKELTTKGPRVSPR
jgi:uncharacterized protein (TIGR03000 family)